MSSDEPTTGTTPPRILWLVMGHVVVGLVGAFVAYPSRSPTLRAGVFLGLVFSQTSLLGIWGGLGSGPWWKRVVGVIVGVGYLSLLFVLGISELDPRILLLVIAATTFVTLPLLIVRFFRLALRLDSFHAASAGHIQFTIRHLMILTFVVACLITIGKWLQPHLPQGDTFFRLLLFTVTFGVVGVLPVWFVLATNRPVLYSIGLVAVGACAGYCLGRILHELAIWTTATATEAVAVVVSLLVVRSCGCRLVRLPARRNGVDPGRKDTLASEKTHGTDAG